MKIRDRDKSIDEKNKRKDIWEYYGVNTKDT